MNKKKCSRNKAEKKVPRGRDIEHAKTNYLIKCNNRNQNNKNQNNRKLFKGIQIPWNKKAIKENELLHIYIILFKR